MTELTSLKELGSIITKSLPNTKYRVKVEVSQPKITNGHMYLTIKDKDGRIGGTIWKSNMTETIKSVKNGDMVEIEGKLGYYSPSGSLSMIVSDLKPCDIVGDKLKQFELMKKEFENKGYFSNKQSLPDVISSMLIITSSNGAAIHDFIYTLDNNKCLVKRTVVDVIVQGNDCPQSIANVFNTMDLSDYDLIVVTRGGGSIEDLWGFNNRIIVECVNSCKKPVLSAIGHMVDTTLIDLVADISCPTPSLAGQYVVEHNMKYLDRIEYKVSTIYTKLVQSINNTISQLNDLNTHVSRYKYDIVTQFNNRLHVIQNYINSFISNRIKDLDSIENKYSDNKIVLLDSKNKEITSSNIYQQLLNKKKHFIVIWNGIKVKVESYTII
jgi:exodeoxyribonuclease VII large subunit